jgi:hypothetical protein
LPRRPTEIRQWRVEPRQDFRRDRQRSLSLRHVGPEQARQRCLQAVADVDAKERDAVDKLQKLIVESLGQQLNGQKQFSYDPSGFVYSRDVPLRSIIAAA